MGIALDLDSGTKTVTFYKNGASSGAIDISSLDLTTPYFIACGHYDNSSQGTFLLRTDSDDWTQSAPAGHKAINSTQIASATTRTKSNLEEYFSTTTYEGNGAGQRVGKFLPFTNTLSCVAPEVGRLIFAQLPSLVVFHCHIFDGMDDFFSLMLSPIVEKTS